MQLGEPRRRPVLRWVGGKARLASRLMTFVPELGDGRYFEPFVGAGSLFFAVSPRKAVLGDMNGDLIAFYAAVRDNPQAVARHLRDLGTTCGAKKYVSMRERFNHTSARFARAALFLFLNRTCFNGVWRVNTSGEFNVPFGQKTRPILPAVEDLQEVAAGLASADLRAADFEESLRDAKAGDFVYLDPPYPARSRTAFFAHYTAGRFASGDHERVARVFEDLHRRGCKVLLSNSHSAIEPGLYNGFEVRRVNVTRFVGSNGHRFRVRDVAVTNF